MAFNSSIKQKKGKCLDCTDDTEKPLIAGRCQNHYWQHRAKISRDNGEIEEAVKNPPKEREVHSLSRSTLVSTLNPYYTYWVRYCGFKCEECGEPISTSDTDGLIGAQAHILPKSPNSGFPSVAVVLENHMTLGARCGCHRKFDKNWLSAQKMDIWPKAVDRFRKFMHLIAKDELRRLPEPLREIYDKEVVG